MYIGEALQKKKRLGQEIAELLELRKQQAWRAETDLKVNFEDIQTDLLEANIKYLDISERITRTNCSTRLSDDKDDMTLMQAVLEIDYLRKEISSLRKIMTDPDSSGYSYSRRSKDDVVLRPYFDMEKIRANKKVLEDRRDMLSSALTKANWTTEITLL